MHEISRVLAGYRSTERAGIKKIRLGNERIFRMHARNDLKCACKARWSIVALPTLNSRTDSFFHAHATQHVLLGRWHFRFLPPRGGFLDRGIGHFTEGLRTVQVGRIDLVVIGKDLIKNRKTGNEARTWTSKCTSVGNAFCPEQESPTPYKFQAGGFRGKSGEEFSSRAGRCEDFDVILFLKIHV